MTPKYFFCTLFDITYLLKGVAMLRSLALHCPQAHVFVLCLDQETQESLRLLALPFISCIPLTDLEDEALLAVKNDRGVAEYCWTLSPCLPWYILEHYPSIDFITYLDADLFFYSSPLPLFEEIGLNSIAIIEHRFTPRLKVHEINGRFCVEWVSFRRDAEGIACLSRWREQCIEWCFYRLDQGRFADQKYLDEWPARYSSCHIIQHVGAGIAPWNYDQFAFSKDQLGQITIEGEVLIFYHFHQFQILNNGRFDRLSNYYAQECPEPSLVYEEYETAFRSVLSDVRSISPEFSAGMKSATRFAVRRLIQRYAPQRLKNFVRRYIRL